MHCLLLLFPELASLLRDAMKFGTTVLNISQIVAIVQPIGQLIQATMRVPNPHFSTRFEQDKNVVEQCRTLATSWFSYHTHAQQVCNRAVYRTILCVAEYKLLVCDKRV